jgi:adenylosuccinate synthase
MLHAVIGGQLGDEGKGLITDFLSNHLTLVVRFNGGAQAGHTVVLPDGRRHEFHHFGAGCFKAACTLLSRHFIVNPLLYAKEYHSPELKGIRKTVYVDPRCRVTTPLDMMLNTLVEERRGAQRHGSCGVGINETVTRCWSDYGQPLTVQDFTVPRRTTQRHLAAAKRN